MRLKCEARWGSCRVVKCISWVLVAVLALNSGSFGQEAPASHARATGAPESAQTSMIKAAVQKHGITQRSRVKVTLRDGSQVIGHISNVDETFFEVTTKSGQSTRIDYWDVNKIGGAGLSKAAKIGIVVGTAVAVTGTVIAIKVATFHLHFGPNWCNGRCP